MVEYRGFQKRGGGTGGAETLYGRGWRLKMGKHEPEICPSVLLLLKHACQVGVLFVRGCSVATSVPMGSFYGVLVDMASLDKLACLGSRNHSLT